MTAGHSVEKSVRVCECDTVLVSEGHFSHGITSILTQNLCKYFIFFKFMLLSFIIFTHYIRYTKKLLPLPK